jgi:hypothetical protein
MRIRIENAKHCYCLEEHLGIAIVRISFPGKGGAGMWYEGADPYHVEGQIAAQEDVIRQCLQRLTRESDHEAAPCLDTEVGEVYEASHPVLKSGTGAQRFEKLRVARLEAQQVSVHAAFMPIPVRLEGPVSHGKGD